MRCDINNLDRYYMIPFGVYLEFSDSLSTLDFSHLAVLHTASVRPSTKVLGTFAVSLSCDDPQKVALEKNLEVLSEAS